MLPIQPAHAAMRDEAHSNPHFDGLAVPFAPAEAHQPAVRNSKEFPVGALASGSAAVADEMDGAAAPPPAPTASDEPAITSSFNIRSNEGAFKVRPIARRPPPPPCARPAAPVCRRCCRPGSAT